MAFRKEHYLYLALVVPVLMILITVLSVYFFRTELESRYNFIYALSPGPSEDCQARLQYQLRPDSFPKQTPFAETKKSGLDCNKLEIYLYDFKTKKATPLTLEQARRFNLFVGLNFQQSPEGISVQSYCYGGEGFGWWGGPSVDASLPSICLIQGNRQQRLTIQTVTPQQGYRKFIFLGWIRDTPQ